MLVSILITVPCDFDNLFLYCLDNKLYRYRVFIKKMACVTLKRSLEFDPLHHGTCTPRPHKRRRCVPMCVSPQSAAAATARHTESQSPFAEVTPTLTPGKYYFGGLVPRNLLAFKNLNGIHWIKLVMTYICFLFILCHFTSGWLIQNLRHTQKSLLPIHTDSSFKTPHFFQIHFIFHYFHSLPLCHDSVCERSVDKVKNKALKTW